MINQTSSLPQLTLGQMRPTREQARHSVQRNQTLSAQIKILNRKIVRAVRLGHVQSAASHDLQKQKLERRLAGEPKPERRISRRDRIRRRLESQI